ncbi:hypothetical protein ACFWE5_07260 [Cellulosimicrobium funkei]|uniref:hypothetical protein n=1 Tax=Cellulosimicrobium funkei TaxID=264251 RepID=UPI0036476600
MSRFHGPQGKGAMRTFREAKHDDAAARRADFERDVVNVMTEYGEPETVARRIVRLERAIRRRTPGMFPRRRATRPQGAPVVRDSNTEG